MNDKGKSRKMDDYKSVSVQAGGARGSQAAGLPPIGRPGMVHPHPNYGLSPAEGFHSAGGRLAYGHSHGGLTQLMQMNRVPGGDLGPPLFMPALNLGTPKVSALPPVVSSTSIAVSTCALSPVSTGFTNSKQKTSLPSLSGQQIISTSSPYVGDMMSYPQPPLSPFHQGPPIKPVSYIPPTSAPIPKPTPISMVTQVASKSPITRVMSGGNSSTADKHMTTPTNKAVPVGVKSGSHSPGDVVMVKGEGLGGVLPQHYQGSGRYCGVSPEVSSTSALTKILAPCSSQTQLATATSAGLVRSVSSYSGSLNDVYSVRSPLVAPVNPPATSGQPSSNSVAADTRLDRPPQPSAPTPPLPVSSCTGGKDNQRLTTAEVASSIIISNPGLTGKHIAAMTNTTQMTPPSSTSYHHHHAHPPMATTSISSGPVSQGTGVPQDLTTPPSAAPSLINLASPMSQHVIGGGGDAGSVAGWSYSSQHLTSNNHMFSLPSSSPASPLPTTPSILGAPPIGGLQGKDLQQSNGFKPRPESSSVPGNGAQSSSIDMGVLTSPAQTTSSSPRPRILRGKRAGDGSWKLDGSGSSVHSPGSPLKSKLFNLKKPLTSPPVGGSDQPPLSPSAVAFTTSTNEPSGRVINHMAGIGRNDGGMTEVFGSPRKKPRKQNVVANDDQYATNVPDTCDDVTSSSNATEVRGQQLPMAMEVDGEGVREKEFWYLAQLRRSQYPINGIYRLSRNTAHNHFRKYTDVKHKEELPISPYELANDRTAQHRASGWKLEHFSSQLQEQVNQEEEVLELMESARATLETVEGQSSCLLDQGAVASTKELLQGNIDRCNRINSHISSTRNTMFSVLDHRPQVLDILDKYSNFKSRFSSISPSLSSSSSSHPPRSHS